MTEIKNKEIKYSIKTLTPLHVGGGAQKAFIDQTVFRIKGKPVIPGSTIKGRIRSIYEEEWRRRLAKCGDPTQLAAEMRKILEEAIAELARYIPGLDDVFREYAPDPKAEPYAYFPLICDPLSELHCNPPESVHDFGDDMRETIRLVASYILLRRAKYGQYCPACTYFGGNGNPSPLVFKPAEIKNDSAEAKLGVATRVSIDRFTHAAKQERLFSYEYVPPGEVFEGSVAVADEINEYVDRKAVEEFLEKLVPELLRRIKQIGKFKSVGLGLVEVRTDGGSGDLEQHIREEALKRAGPEEDLKKELREQLEKRFPNNADAIAEIITRHRERVKREVCAILGL